jgi:hypothetical protein
MGLRFFNRVNNKLNTSRVYVKIKSIKNMCIFVEKVSMNGNNEYSRSYKQKG